MPLIDGLPDYVCMMSRSLSLWKEFLTEMLSPDEPKLASEAIKAKQLLDGIEYLRTLLPPDPGPLRPPGIFAELERELDFLHKRIVHSLPDRSFAHERVRLIEQLLADLKAQVPGV
jgi:hypothetical protein